MEGWLVRCTTHLYFGGRQGKDDPDGRKVPGSSCISNWMEVWILTATKTPIVRVVGLLWVLFWVIGTQPLQASESERIDGLTNRVIAIMWDAFAPSYIDGRANTPHLDRLIRGGVIYPNLQVVYPAVTNVSWTSMLTGASPDATGNLAYWWNRHSNVASGMSRQYSGETIAEAVRRGGKRSLSIGMWLLDGRGVSSMSPQALYLDPGPEFDQRIDVLIDVLNGRYGYDPHFIAVYANHLDETGHDYGPTHQRVIDKLEAMDRSLGRLLAEMEGLGVLNETTLVIVGDHGMTEARVSLRNAVSRALALEGYIIDWVASGGGSASLLSEIVAVSPGRSAFMYFKGRNMGSNQPQRPFTEAEQADVIDILLNVPGVARVLSREELDAMGVHPLQGDFVIETEPPYAFFPSTTPDMRGTHSSTTEMFVPLILYGAGIKSSSVVAGGRSLDIAPTISYLLGVPAPSSSEGTVLFEALLYD